MDQVQRDANAPPAGESGFHPIYKPALAVIYLRNRPLISFQKDAHWIVAACRFSCHSRRKHDP